MEKRSDKGRSGQRRVNGKSIVSYVCKISTEVSCHEGKRDAKRAKSLHFSEETLSKRKRSLSMFVDMPLDVLGEVRN